MWMSLGNYNVRISNFYFIFFPPPSTHTHTTSTLEMSVSFLIHFFSSFLTDFSCGIRELGTGRLWRIKNDNVWWNNSRWSELARGIPDELLCRGSPGRLICGRNVKSPGNTSWYTLLQKEISFSGEGNLDRRDLAQVTFCTGVTNDTTLRMLHLHLTYWEMDPFSTIAFSFPSYLRSKI